MEESLTQGNTQAAASIEPTVAQSIEPTADGNQETISTPSEEGNEAVSTTPADNNISGGVDDEGLAKFAKGQGYSDEDIAGMSEREKKTLLSLKKNVDQFRNPDKKIVETVTESVEEQKANETEDEAFKREFRQYKYEKIVDNFWADNTKDRSLEPIMAKILTDKKAELAPQIGEEEARKYCFALSRDLKGLYSMAQLESGVINPAAAKQEGRQEERDSIKRQNAAAPEGAHAVQTSPQTQPKITSEWIRNEYNPNNPEHRALVDSLTKR